MSEPYPYVSPPLSKKQATLGKTTSVNTPTNNYTPALNPSGIDNITVNTCA